MEMKTEDSGSQVYDTKTIEVEDGKGTLTRLMITRVDGSQNRVMSSAGFRGNYYLFTVLKSGTMKTDYDVFRAKRGITGVQGNDMAAEVLMELDTGGVPWDEIEDGKRYSVYEVEKLVEGADG